MPATVSHSTAATDADEVAVEVTGDDLAAIGDDTAAPVVAADADADADAEPIVYVSTLDRAALEHAASELGETPEARDSALAEIGAWLAANPHIRARRDARSVLHFLRGSKFRLDRAKGKMTM